MLHSVCQQICQTQQWPPDGKGQFSFQYQRRAMPKNVQTSFRKAEEKEIKLPTSAESQKKQESSRKTSIFALLTMPKPLTVWITTNCGKFLKRWEYQTTLPAF